MLHLAWELEDFKAEMTVYQELCMIYFHNGDLEKAKYYQ